MEPLALGVMLGFGDDPRKVLKKAQDLRVPTGQMGRPSDKYLAGEGLDELRTIIGESGVEITTVFCGFKGESYADIPTVRRTVGLVPGATRAERVEETKQIIDFARAIGVRDVAAHIGFIPEDRTDPDHNQLVEVLQDICDHAAACSEAHCNGQNFSLETGQETGQALLQFIQDVGRDNLKVNFDPANM
ncbi:MAG: TIM barrel protein, partial [Planctomycetes bacterium]|nr:TIM barrel protein [Planctomycetota bacterium]